MPFKHHIWKFLYFLMKNTSVFCKKIVLILESIKITKEGIEWIG